jgi:hypothetical protein
MPSKGGDRLVRAGWEKTVFEENDRLAEERGIVGYRMKRVNESTILRFAILEHPGPKGGRTILVSKYHKPGVEDAAQEES